MTKIFTAAIYRLIMASLIYSSGHTTHANGKQRFIGIFGLEYLFPENSIGEVRVEQRAIVPAVTQWRCQPDF